MLAPRKKLWSTPSSAVEIALDFADLGMNDVVYDVGCGDGRVLIQMAAMSVAVVPPHPSLQEEEALSDNDGGSSSCCGGGEQQKQSSPTNTTNSKPLFHQQHHCHQFVGIEISPQRAAEARTNIHKAQQSHQIPKHVTIIIICANALDTALVDYTKATVIFLYLVPRGLRLIKDIVWPIEGEEGDCEGEGGDVNSTTNQSQPQLSQPQSQAEITAAADIADSTRSKTTIPSNSNINTRPRRIITYMAPFENTLHIRKEYCKVDHQEGAAWPVYLYHVL